MWQSVGPGLRVLPLTPQVAFAVQSGDPVFRPPEAGGFVRLCRPDPLPVSASPFRTSIASRSLPARWTHRGFLNVLVPVATAAFLVTGFVRSVETTIPHEHHSDRGWFLFAALRRVSRSHARTGANPPGETGEICLRTPAETCLRRGRATNCTRPFRRYRRICERPPDCSSKLSCAPERSRIGRAHV